MASPNKNLTPEEYRLIVSVAREVASKWDAEELVQELALFIFSENYSREPIFDGVEPAKEQNIWKKWEEYREESTGDTYSGKQVVMLRNEARHLDQVLKTRKVKHKLTRRELYALLPEFWETETVQTVLAGMKDYEKQSMNNFYLGEKNPRVPPLTSGTYYRRLDRLLFAAYQEYSLSVTEILFIDEYYKEAQ